jgi:hypothetical protein
VKRFSNPGVNADGANARIVFVAPDGEKVIAYGKSNAEIADQLALSR